MYKYYSEYPKYMSNANLEIEARHGIIHPV